MGFLIPKGSSSGAENAPRQFSPIFSKNLQGNHIWKFLTLHIEECRFRTKPDKNRKFGLDPFLGPFLRHTFFGPIKYFFLDFGHMRNQLWPIMVWEDQFWLTFCKNDIFFSFLNVFYLFYVGFGNTHFGF